MFWVIVGVLFAAWLFWYSNLSAEQKQAITDARKEREQGRRAEAASLGKVGTRQRLSKVGERGEGGVGLACPRCGGVQFTAKRSMKGKIAVGVLAPKTQVRCVTCGAMYKRG